MKKVKELMSVKDMVKMDLPPTNADVKTRIVHTKGSIEHNLKHIEDHTKNLCEALEKLATADIKAARKASKHINDMFEKLHEKVEECCEACEND